MYIAYFECKLYNNDGLDKGEGAALVFDKGTSMHDLGDIEPEHSILIWSVTLKMYHIC